VHKKGIIMKICNMCKSPETNYTMVINQDTPGPGLAHWELDFCADCVKLIEEILTEALDKATELAGA